MKGKRRGTVVAVGLTAVIAFGLGIAIGVFKLPPYRLLMQIQYQRAIRNTVPNDDHGTDVAAIIDIVDTSDITRKRRQLRELIWGAQGLPEGAQPDQIDQGITDDRYAGLENLDRIDRLTTTMDWGIQSVAYHFVPRRDNGILVIYHQGHGSDFAHGIDVIATFIKQGYAVIGLAMPLMGMNNQPIVELPRFGNVKLTTHNHLLFVPPAEGHAVRYFLEPVTVAVNYALSRGYRQVAMIGLSGGGWTTTVYAAVDPRITRSYPVAGTQPIFLRDEISDFEQASPEIYEIANYLELYVMGSHGQNRAQIQLLNAYDPCCSPGLGATRYGPAVSERIRQLGSGSFELFVDFDERLHRISKAALERVLDDLEMHAGT